MRWLCRHQHEHDKKNQPFLIFHGCPCSTDSPVPTTFHQPPDDEQPDNCRKIRDEAENAAFVNVVAHFCPPISAATMMKSIRAKFPKTANGNASAMRKSRFHVDRNVMNRKSWPAEKSR